MSNSKRTAGRILLESFKNNSNRVAIRRSSGFPQITYGELLDRDNKQLQYARNLFKAVSNKESVV